MEHGFVSSVVQNIEEKNLSTAENVETRHLEKEKCLRDNAFNILNGIFYTIKFSNIFGKFFNFVFQF